MSHRNLGGYAYGIGVPIDVLLLILAVSLLNYLCKKKRLLPSESSQGTNNFLTIITIGGDSVGTRQREGIEEVALDGFPKIIYFDDKLNNIKGDDESSLASSCCYSICLMDYKEKDLLRLLPDCDHRFHLRCVNPWLRLNPMCPVCRNSPLPTPFAEVPVPLPKDGNVRIVLVPSKCQTNLGLNTTNIPVASKSTVVLPPNKKRILESLPLHYR
ncbi:RING-H2 finger protein ATL70-like [Ziziphus jujuba]|uniref:RING-H2 finger protein ATL70-like n=1 Tax=Ziziphus jujuba TaxID=326968 RepID=A0ABM4AGB6_ZIZJJ|nr:RING-H2 finger protein ATL70-like [Ziziphus jujuba]